MKSSPLFKSGTLWKHAALASGSVLIFLWACFFFLDFFTKHNEHMEVPDFKGIYVNDLDKFVAGKDLEFEVVDSVYHDKLPKGTVIDQEPRAGATVKVGRKIYLTVNAKVNKKVPVPNLIDLSLRQARSLLESYGLKVGRLTYVEGLPPVMKQSFQGQPIAPNTLVDKGSAIDLVLGMGNQHSLIQIPDLFGMTLPEAGAMLSSKGLILGTVLKDETAGDTLSARIYKQVPSPDHPEGLYEGARVNVWLTGSEKVLESESKHISEIE